MLNGRLLDADHLRIEHVLPTLANAGMETVVVRLSLALAAAGHEVAVTCTEALGPLADSLHQRGIDTALVPAPGIWSNYSATGLRQRFKSRRLHVVHVHSGAWLKAARAARQVRVPRVIHTMHGLLDSEPWFGPLLKRAAAHSTDATLAVSEPLQRYLVRTCMISAASVSVVLNGIPTDLFAPTACADQRSPRAKLRALTDGPVIGTVARLAPVKNHPLLLKAFARAHALYPQTILVLAGDGPERNHLTELAHRLGVGPAVHFLGEVTDPASLYRQLDVFVLPSTAEGTSISLLEALASGVPAIATDVGGNGYVLDNGKAGILVPSGDELALADALVALISDHGRRRTLAAAGRQRVCALFSESRMVQRYVDIYRRGRAALEPV